MIVESLFRTEAHVTRSGGGGETLVDTTTWIHRRKIIAYRFFTKKKRKKKEKGVDDDDVDDVVDYDLCAVFCPAGQEQDGSQELCRPCDIGFYRTGDNPYSSCELCPNNTRTMTTGSKSVDDCAICKSYTLGATEKIKTIEELEYSALTCD